MSKSGPKPVAWKYEIAQYMIHGHYQGWSKRVAEEKPNVPEAAIRNLEPLYAQIETTDAEYNQCFSRAIEIADTEYQHWIKEALKHKRSDGRRSDHANSDLERAKVARRIVDKLVDALSS